MNRRRVGLYLVTLTIIISAAAIVGLYARGYRFDKDSSTITTSGLLVVKSNPDGAQVFIDNELTTATNDSLNLAPGTYDVTIKKEGYLSWDKRLIIEPEVVTEITADLFKAVPSLSAITLNTSLNPVASRDQSKIAYVVPTDPDNLDNDKSGLWILDTLNLPLGFSRGPKRITDGLLNEAEWIWSPDGREILLTTQTGTFLLSADKFTPQNQRVNIASKKAQILEAWQAEQAKKLAAQMKKLPDKLTFILKRSAESVVFSPDEDMILYTVKDDDLIEKNLIKQLPGSSTQKEERNIKKGRTYVYDIKEDRNFLVDDHSEGLAIENGLAKETKRKMSWFATSRHLVLAEENQIIIMDYDGTNRQVVYSGSYQSPNAFPTLSTNRLLILTNLGAGSSPSNIYSLSLK